MKHSDKSSTFLYLSVLFDAFPLARDVIHLEECVDEHRFGGLVGHLDNLLPLVESDTQHTSLLGARVLCDNNKIPHTNTVNKQIQGPDDPGSQALTAHLTTVYKERALRTLGHRLLQPIAPLFTKRGPWGLWVTHLRPLHLVIKPSILTILVEGHQRNIPVKIHQQHSSFNDQLVFCVPVIAFLLQNIKQLPEHISEPWIFN